MSRWRLRTKSPYTRKAVVVSHRIQPIAVRTSWMLDPRKALEVLRYVVRRLGRRATPGRILAIITLADRLHLERYGRFVSTDSYLALQGGLVPRWIATWLYQARTRPRPHAHFRFQGARVIAKGTTDREQFSATDIECLQETLVRFRRTAEAELRRHCVTPACRTADALGEVSILSIAKTLPNAKDLLAYLDG